MRRMPNIDLGAEIRAGTIAFHKVVAPDQLQNVLQSYNVALLDPFYLAAAASAVSFCFAVGLPWVGVKGKAPSAETV